ncbi:MAG TPA: tetratricopeptide repeat protein [Thermoflexia bacterium]|nr:tetratricopeptide repeat protein [Thermoflexia bacterium]
MHPSLLILLIGLFYLLGFGALSFMRRQGLSTRFAVEGVIITIAAAALVYASVPIYPILFFVVLYIITMRARLLVDLGNWFTSRGRYEQALSLFRLALRLGVDVSSRQIVLINRGVTQLLMQEPEAARLTLEEALADEKARAGAKYLAAGYYNLGLACRRTEREAEAIRHFNQSIDAWPNSIHARAATQALKPKQTDQDQQ